jgi:HEAT repeat protein
MKKNARHEAMKRMLAVVISFVIIGGSGLTTGQDIQAEQKARIEQHITSLGTRYWDKAVEELVRIGEPAVGPLIAALRPEVQLISARACLALARIGTSQAVDAVFKALDEGSSGVRSEAAGALRYIGSDRAVERLLDLVGKDGDYRVRMSAAGALGMMGSGKSIDVLAAALNDSNQYVRSEAAASLGKLRSEKSVDPLLRASRDDSSLVRQAARDALVKIGSPAAPAIARTLRDPDPQVRWTAALMLGKIASEQAVPALIEALSDAHWMVGNEAAVALARIRSERSVALLKALLQGQNANLSAVATWVLAEIQTPRPGPYLRAIEDQRRDGIQIIHALYPQTLRTQPRIPSPCWTGDKEEVVVARTATNHWAVIPVTLENNEKRGRQLMVDAVDFPALAASGLHSEKELDTAQAITGRSLAEITSLGQPGGFSTDGFMAADEDVLSVLRGDNRLVSAMNLTHRELARPLFHVWNMIGTDLDLGRWNMTEHRWQNIQSVLYNGKTVLLNAGDTKGAQLSIFADGFDDGSFWIEISRDLETLEKAFLASKYGHLTAEQRDVMVKRLTFIRTGEMEPHYIMWYGFYEGHTDWRADPLAIAFIFGLRSLEELEKAFPGRLYEVLTKHFSRENR